MALLNLRALCVCSIMHEAAWKVVNDTINFIEPKLTFIESKITNCTKEMHSLDGQILLWQVYVNFWPQLYIVSWSQKDATTKDFVQRWRPSGSQLTIYCLICLIILWGYRSIPMYTESRRMQFGKESCPSNIIRAWIRCKLTLCRPSSHVGIRDQSYRCLKANFIDVRGKCVEWIPSSS